MTELALRSDVPNSLGDQMELAKALATSGLLPSHLAGKPQNILAIMYAARSIDVPLWQAMQSMQVINGKVGLSADMMRALILRAGHSCRVMESTDERATVEIVRSGEDFIHVSTFTMDDARTAGLASGTNWSKYPKAMLVARATTAVARQACADVLAGMSYTPEELGATVDEEGRVVDGIPRNQDGSVSRSRTTDDEKAAAGVMTSTQQAEHSALANVKDKKKAERLSETPADDQWQDQPAGEVAMPVPDSVKFCEKWLVDLEMCVTPETVESALVAARREHENDRINTKQLGTLVAAASARTRELGDA